MSITKECWCCGLLLVYPDGLEVYPCPACGAENERPKVEGIMLENFRRAIRQQLNRDFCDAEKSYQFVLNSRPDNAEALWGRLMCHYGAVFISDKGTRKYEIHFPRRKPLREQGDFLRACELAKPAVRAQYEQDAEYIDNANARILALAESKQPYDIFLCHKTTLISGGGYTEDYNRAYRLYSLLTQKGYRVFFAPVEMPETAAGEDYEATIYHALDTSKVMLAVCSDLANLQSTWVQSEWRRYLEKIDEGQKKRLIPLLYGGMKAAQLPKEFHNHNLQAITMELGGEKALLKVLDRQVKTRKGLLKPVTAALVAVVLLAVAGAAYLAGRGSLPVGGRMPTATPTATPTAAPSPTPMVTPTPTPSLVSVEEPKTEELTASAKGFLSDVKVTVTLNEDGTIAAMAVDCSGETPAIAAFCAEEGFLSQFIGKKGPFVRGRNVDGVTGATHTSDAVINAVNSLFPVTATEKGLLGDVGVTVVFTADGAIARLDADLGQEIFGKELITDDFLGQFIGQKGPFENVEVVSGATLTSDGIMMALNKLFADNGSEEKPLIYQSVVDALSAEVVDIPMKVRVVAEEERARSGPGAEYAASAYVFKDQRFTVYAEKKHKNREKWYRICVEGVYCWIPESSCEHSLEIIIEE